MPRWRVGVDAGGTFTDICLFDESDGRIDIWKVASTPDDPSRGIAAGVEQGQLRAAGVAAVAIAFLYSFVRPEHEQAAKRTLQEELPDAFICASHEIAPEFREFERLSTAVVNAYLGPVMKRYIERLGARLGDLGMEAAPHMTQSNGGVIGFAAAAAMPVRTILSGPSTGVIGAQAVGAAAGFTDLITFDMGGTSTDVAL